MRRIEGSFHSPPTSQKAYIQQINTLELILDISHWINVSESYLLDQDEAVKLAIERTNHIHARVGHPEGPQIPDPRVPHWQDALAHHFAIWDRVVNHRRSCEPNAVVTFTPEFGAPPYMILLPRTNKPISDQWEVNKFMLDILKARYYGITKMNL